MNLMGAKDARENFLQALRDDTPTESVPAVVLRAYPDSDQVGQALS